jgi:hypothetical protein
VRCGVRSGARAAGPAVHVHHALAACVVAHVRAARALAHEDVGAHAVERAPVGQATAVPPQRGLRAVAQPFTAGPHTNYSLRHVTSTDFIIAGAR